MRKALIILAVLLAAAVQADAISFFNRGGDLAGIFEELELLGPDAGTVRKLEGYVERNPGAEHVDEALLRLGRIYNDRRDIQKADEAYRILISNFPRSRFRQEAEYELGLLMYRTGRLDEARSALDAVRAGEGASLTLRAKASRFLREMERAAYGIRSADLPAIGVLLPLKGDYAGFGEDALSGVLLAAEVFGTGGPRAEVIVKDISDEASIGRAVSELASNGRVVGLVGPLLSSTAMDVARHAQMQRVPVITLSQKDGVTDAGDYVFRNFLTPEDQASALADYAAGPLGARRFAVLYPQSAYGVELARNFEAAVKGKGGTVVRQSAYPQGTTDFSETVKRTFGVQTKERKEGRRVIREFSPTVSVDALFIPDSYEAVALLAPYLEYYNVKGLRLLGANGWNSPRLVELAGKKVEGAVFVDGFFSGSKRGGVEEFSSDFSSVFDRPPGIISAQAFDAARMLLHAAGDSGERGPVKERLRLLKEFRGVTGDISFNPRRDARKRLFVLTVEGGRIVEAGI